MSEPIPIVKVGPSDKNPGYKNVNSSSMIYVTTPVVVKNETTVLKETEQYKSTSWTGYCSTQ